MGLYERHVSTRRRHVFSYIKDVKARGPAVTLKLTQSDDRAIVNMRLFQNNCCYWACLCLSVILLLPFCVWIFLTGGSWPVSAR